MFQQSQTNFKHSLATLEKGKRRIKRRERGRAGGKRGMYTSFTREGGGGMELWGGERKCMYLNEEDVHYSEDNIK